MRGLSVQLQVLVGLDSQRNLILGDGVLNVPTITQLEDQSINQFMAGES